MRGQFLFLLFLWASPLRAAEGSSDTLSVFLAQSTPIAVAFMLSVTAIKITAFVLGYLIVRLGHDTLIKGITGEIDFGFTGQGVEAKLKAGSPGAIFIVAGAAIIIWGLTVERPMSLSLNPPVAEATVPAPAVESPAAPAIDRRSVPD